MAADDLSQVGRQPPVLGQPAADLAVIGIEHLALVLHQTGGVPLVLIDGFEQAGVFARVGLQQGEPAHVVQQARGVARVLVQPARLRQ